jgi:hypothetical protein
MSAILGQAAARIQADQHAYTGGGQVGELASQTTAGPTVNDVLHPLAGVGEMFTGGVHPEAVPDIVVTDLSRATDSLRGALGGLRPRGNGVLAPGPAGALPRAVESIKVQVPSTLDRIRARLFPPPGRV